MIMYTEKGLQFHYGNADKLNARINIHQKNSVSNIDLVDWSLNYLSIKGNEEVLDAGCGSGQWLFPISERLSTGTVTGFDMSEGMLEHVKQKANGNHKIQVVQGDMQNMSFNDNEFDRIMANFCLYLIPDINQAISEFYRVLKPDGIFMATTGGINRLSELVSIHQDAQKKLCFPEEITNAPNHIAKFTLENGGNYLHRVFPFFEKHVLYDQLSFNDVHDVLTFYRSSLMYKGTNGENDDRVSPQQWMELIDYVGGAVENIIAQKGRFLLSRTSGVFVAKKYEL
jgi:ubiquinone/menaquinone biosynthesis C-methylase UbiE